MSQLDEFKAVAIAHGRASLRDHIKNYFDVTGRLADEVGIKSMSARVNRALRVGGQLADLAGSVVLPNKDSRGKQAEWTVGHQPIDDALGDLDIADSKELEPLINLLNEKDKPEFLMTSSDSYLQTAIARAARGSRIAQRELGQGYMAQEYERRLRAMNETATRRENERVVRESERKDRIIESLLSAGGSQRSNGRSLMPRRNSKNDDETPLLRDENA